MNNQELELRIKEIINEGNFFNMIEKALEFEKEYKTTSFYKNTKMPLMTVIEKSKLFYSLKFDGISSNIQSIIDNLDVNKLQSLIEDLGNLYTRENEDMMQVFSEFSKIVK